MANSKKKCKHCKDYYPATGGVKLPAGWFHTFDCALLFAANKQLKDRDKALSKSKREFKQETVRLKKELNQTNLKWQHKQTQPAFNKLRVAEELRWFEDRGLQPTCISCQQELGGDQWCCGHFKTVGSNGRLRYDKANTYLQHNRSCNMAKSGDIEGYKIGLVARFGENPGKGIIAYCEENNSPIKWAWQDLEEMRASFNKQLRDMDKS